MVVSSPADAPVPEAAPAPDGLTSHEAARRLALDGPNRLPVPRGVPAWRQLLGQLGHFFALMLWVAAALAVVAGMPQLGVAIVIVVVLNGVFAFVQEYRAERAAQQLRDLLPRRARVVRDGRVQDVDADLLVRDDLVVLDAGDRISADMRVVDAHALSIDTSTMTGESVPVTVDEGALLHAGTFVVEGQGRAAVVATGASTQLAGIAAMTRATPRPRGPLAQELRRVVVVVAAIAVSVGTSFLGISLLVGIPVDDGLLFAIGVTVALVPEGLLPTVTLSLAIGAQRLAHRHALVRRLDAVETLGSTTFICTDKTGTLTENRMAVVDAWTPQGSARISGDGYEPTGTVEYDDGASGADAGAAEHALAELAYAAVRCSNGRAVLVDGEWHAQGDPMEAALEVLARRVGVGVDERAAGEPVRRWFPFDARRRRMSMVGGTRLVVKGAPDAVLPRCVDVDGEVAPAIEGMARQGRRLLAVAARDLGGDMPGSADEAERDLVLLGVVGFEDPPRGHARAAIDACRQAGMKVAMITGDHPVTAGAIAREVGLMPEGGLVLAGDELPSTETASSSAASHPNRSCGSRAPFVRGATWSR
jgi:magnesium-transporting ATPase (P-type)